MNREGGKGGKLKKNEVDFTFFLGINFRFVFLDVKSLADAQTTFSIFTTYDADCHVFVYTFTHLHMFVDGTVIKIKMLMNAGVKITDSATYVVFVAFIASNLIDHVSTETKIIVQSAVLLITCRGIRGFTSEGRTE